MYAEVLGLSQNGGEENHKICLFYLVCYFALFFNSLIYLI